MTLENDQNIVKLNHIGVAINSSENLIKLFKILGYSLSHQEKVLDQDVETFFIPLPIAETKIELLKPISGTGTVAKFLQKRGGGVHHLSFECSKGKLLQLSKKIFEAGFEFIYPEPKQGAHGMMVNFIHPKTADGLLIEIMEQM